MPIETIHDWNERLVFCHCCLMPYCGNLGIDTQQLTYRSNSYGFSGGATGGSPFDIATWRRYKIKTQTRTGSYFDSGRSYGSTPPTYTDYSVSSNYNWIVTTELSEVVGALFVSASGVCSGGNIILSQGVSTTECTGTGNYTYSATAYQDPAGILLGETTTICTTAPQDPSAVGSSCRFTKTCTTGSSTTTTTQTSPIINATFDDTTDETEYTESINWSDWLTVARSIGDAWFSSSPEACWVSVGAYGIGSKTTVVVPISAGPNGSLGLEYFRFRWKIPFTHSGTYYKITWDVAEFPIEGDPFYVSEDNVFEWTGPGTGSQSNPSWYSPWQYIEPPSAAGQRRFVNIRYTCYHGTKYGVKPQTAGESFTPPAP